jgi:hypothetical protein
MRKPGKSQTAPPKAEQPEVVQDFGRRASRKLERTARIFPEIARIIRARRTRGGIQWINDDAIKLAEAWANPDNRFETVEAAKVMLAQTWPKESEREGRAKWSDYEDFLPFKEDIKKVGCRAYLVSLADGSTGHLCRYEMNRAQRDQVRATLSTQRTEQNDVLKAHDKFDREMTKLGVPDNLAPSDYLARRPVADAAD